MITVDIRLPSIDGRNAPGNRGIGTAPTKVTGHRDGGGRRIGGIPAIRARYMRNFVGILGAVFGHIAVKRDAHPQVCCRIAGWYRPPLRFGTARCAELDYCEGAFSPRAGDLRHYSAGSALLLFHFWR